MRYYVDLIHKDAESDFGVSCPDFLGRISAQATLIETAAFGAEALIGQIELMTDEGLPDPEPFVRETVVEKADGVPVMVPDVVREAVRAVRDSITVPKDIPAKIDALAESWGMSRSGFLTQAARRRTHQA